ncbi:MAG: cellulose binding domain-containing protein [Ruminococcus sp.]|nr:cellulose binding domain-containing protein [Ruminococcus sp.]
MDKRVYRLTSIIIIFFMCISIFVTIPINASVYTNVTEYENYCVEYFVTNEWDGYQNIEIELTNISDKPLYNWALGFNAGGEVSGVWNGVIYKNNGTNYIIKNAGYNNVIETGESINFGYTLNNAEGMPEKMMFV